MAKQANAVQQAAYQTQVEWARKLKARTREEVRQAYEETRQRYTPERCSDAVRALADADFDRG